MNTKGFQLDLLLPGRSFTTPDDRARPIQIGAMRELRGAPAQQDPRIERLMDQAAATIQSAVPKRISMLIGASFPIGMIAISALLPTGVPMWALAVPYFVCIGLLTNILVRRRFRAIAPNLAALFIAEGICACCGYNLDGTTPANDQYTCPECGAAWNTSRVHRTAPIVLTSAEPLLRDQARRGLRAYINQMDRRTAKDDNGRAYSPARVRDLRRFRKAAQGEHKSALSEAIGDLAFKGFIWRLLVGLLFIVMAIAVAVPNFLVASRLRSPWLLVGLLPVFMFALMAAAILMSDFGRPAMKSVAKLRELGLCPCCAQRLDDLSAGEDGLVRCPTCLCCWGAPRCTAQLDEDAMRKLKDLPEQP